MLLNNTTGVRSVVSTSAGGEIGDFVSTSPQISRDGRYVVFCSFSTNLVAGASGGQVFRKDLQTGAIDLISSTDGTAANQGSGLSSYGAVSLDGRYVVFQSSSTNLVAGSTGQQVLRKDLQTGTIDVVSSPDGSAINRGNASSSAPQMTSDGRYVVFYSSATNLVAGTSGTQVFRKDLQTGTIDLVSSTDGSGINQGNASSASPQVSANGRYVVFYSASTNFVAGSSGGQVFRKDLQTGTIDLVSSTDGTAGNQGNAAGNVPQISADGRYVVFYSNSTNFVAGASGTQVYRKDLQVGTIELVSSVDGSAANQGDGASNSPQCSADGRYVIFNSSASNLVAGGSGGQLYRKDMQVGTVDLVSSTDGTAANQGNGTSSTPELTADGAYVVFVSSSANLVAGVSGNQIYLKRMP